MKIIIQDQHLNVNNIDVIAVSSSSNIQVGDNDQVVLYCNIETPSDSVIFGPFPTSPVVDSPLSRHMVPLPNVPSKANKVNR